MNSDTITTIAGWVKVVGNALKEYAPAPFNLIGPILVMIGDAVHGIMTNKPVH